MASGFWVGLFVFVMLGAEGLRYFKRKGTPDLIKEIIFSYKSNKTKNKNNSQVTRLCFLFFFFFI